MHLYADAPKKIGRYISNVAFPFQSENGNHLVDLTVEYLDDFPFGDKLNETINRVFNLTPEEP